MVFSHCINLDQDSIDNIEANALLKIQSLAEKWASRYDQQFSPSSIPRSMCCFLGNKISAERFESRSMKSSLILKIAPSGSSVKRFLVFVICLVANLKSGDRINDLEFICEMTAFSDSGFKEVRSELFFGSFDGKQQRCRGDHVFILRGDEMWSSCVLFRKRLKKFQCV
ncbi:hypothetical protein GQ457_14G025220 [Hibiscus cannabinus]